MKDRGTVLLGVAALALWAIHASWHVTHHQIENLLWCCHVGAALVSAGLLARAPAVLGTGLLLQALGLFMWAIDLASGGELIPTSPLTHLGVLSIGLAGAKRIGLPRGSWLRAAVVLLGLHVLSRFVTPVDGNVNLAFAVHPSLSRVFHSHDLYIATITVVLSIFMLLLERAMRWAGIPEPARRSEPHASAASAVEAHA